MNLIIMFISYLYARKIHKENSNLVLMNSTQIAFQRVGVIAKIGCELEAFVRNDREIGFVLVGLNQGCNTFKLNTHASKLKLNIYQVTK